MAFDYTKFLSENQLTTTSRLRERFFQEEEEAAIADQSDKAAKLKQLTAQKDEILAQYQNGSLSLDQYRTKIGNIPQQIKQLRADLDAELNTAPEEEEGEFDQGTAPAPEGVDQEEEVPEYDQPEEGNWDDEL